jgi:coenzyme F420-reducing hydrogenase beta subunit
MNNISEYSDCANCGACYNACPVSAIHLKEDGLFYSVEVDTEKCINCGACKRVCPVNNYEKHQEVISSYGGCSMDPESVNKSSSGGAFYELAQVVLSNGGIVFAAAYSDDFREVCFYSTEEKSLSDLMKSKYVESKVGVSFKAIKAELDIGREVMFCGAPCQVAGLKSYLKRDYSNLLTCDFSCGGMPSHKMYVEHLDAIERKLKSPISLVDFRSKTYGWDLHSLKMTSRSGKKYLRLYFQDPYFYCFVGNHISVRDYCYKCKFADNHYSDIILADFWKCRTASRIPNNHTGLSLIITCSPKGEEYIQRIRKRFALTILDNEKATYNLKEKNPPSDDFIKNREAFLTKCQNEGFAAATKSIKLKSGVKIKAKFYLKKLLMK